MKDDYTTNSHCVMYTFPFKRLGECRCTHPGEADEEHLLVGEHGSRKAWLLPVALHPGPVRLRIERKSVTKTLAIRFPMVSHHPYQHTVDMRRMLHLPTVNPSTPKSDQFKFPLQSQQKYNIAQYEEFGIS